MVYRIHPSIPLVWRSPTSVQFGVDTPRVVLHDVTPTEELLVAALVAGVHPSGLAMIARSAGGVDADVEQLLSRLAPVLAPEQPARIASTAEGLTLSASAARDGSAEVAVVGAGPTVDRIAELLAAEGVRVAVTASAAGAPTALAIAVAHYVLDPELYGYWLRRDIPHLPVIFGDTGVTIGPVVTPGRGPCLYCLERHRTDADGAWPAIAAQLWGRVSPVESALVSQEVAARVTRLAVGVLAGDGRWTATSVRLNAADGIFAARTERPHPRCGCISPTLAFTPDAAAPASAESAG